MEAVWQAALPRLREVIGERNFETWIQPIHCERDEDGLRLEVSSRFRQEWVTKHYLSSICQLLHPQGISSVRVVVVSDARPESTDEPAPAPRRVTAHARAQRTLRVGRLMDNYVFDNFVVGPSNQVACQAARDVVENPGRRFNPFFVWGGVGLGKTHLVNAIGHAVLRDNLRGRVGCLSAEVFMNTMIGALRQDQMNGFRERFRELDVLILDDVQFLADKERTQEEFIHTFEALYTAGKQIVLTSDKPPQAISEMAQRLRSRFEGGLIADVRPPTFEMRIEIARRKARAHGTEISPEIAGIIARCSGPSVRELEGALTRVLANVSLEGVPLSPEVVEGILKSAGPVGKPISLDAVLTCVAKRFGVTVEDLRSHRRDRAIIQPRQIAMYLSRALAGASLAGIAEKFGGRDHTTVLYAVRTLEERKNRDHMLQSVVDELTMNLQSRKHG